MNINNNVATRLMTPPALLYRMKDVDALRVPGPRWLTYRTSSKAMAAHVEAYLRIMKLEYVYPYHYEQMQTIYIRCAPLHLSLAIHAAKLRLDILKASEREKRQPWPMDFCIVMKTPRQVVRLDLATGKVTVNSLPC